MIYHIVPLTDNAHRFAQKHGTTFHLTGFAKPATLSLIGRDGRSIRVEKKTEGIFVDGHLFCREW